jgi:DNA invertase Pin-like site-specific DNA recombinase
MPGQKIGYKRVSTLIQRTDRQLDGMVLDQVFEDKTSGAKLERPELTRCIEYCRKGDALYVHSIDRLARDIVHLRTIIDKLLLKGVSINFVKEGLNFNSIGGSNPVSDLMLSVIGAIAEFERQLLLERQKEGVAAAHKRGVKFGAKPKLNPEQELELMEDIKTISKSKIAEKYGVSRATVYNIIKAHKLDGLLEKVTDSNKHASLFSDRKGDELL